VWSWKHLGLGDCLSSWGNAKMRSNQHILSVHFLLCKTTMEVLLAANICLLLPLWRHGHNLA
jgi:hypothetical protein